MGTFIITLVILSFAAWIFTHIWKLALKFFYYALLGAIEVIKKIIVAVRRLGKVIFLMYKRHKNGRVYKVEYKEEEVDEDDIPEGLKEELECHEEVIVKKDDIDQYCPKRFCIKIKKEAEMPDKMIILAVITTSLSFRWQR